MWLSAKRLVEQDCYHTAILLLDQAVQCAPAAYLYDYRGVVLCLIGRGEEALASFAQALACPASRSLQAEVYFHRGILYGGEMAYELALLDFTHALQLVPAQRTYEEAIAQIKREQAAMAEA
ncbi:hypothetical protein [Reticulibacter mediterranei]|uniref:hypothetical protein n=1 Tax=Reticulibacter mediterranei TaxID=2778369 RepID=UPI001C692248|nr:hypothetical protein [Reticulibacter mediterranei]